MSTPSLETDEASLQCCFDGCRRRWTNDFGHGKLCSIHDDMRRTGRRAEKAQAGIPNLQPATAHWQDAKERDDEPLPF